MPQQDYERCALRAVGTPGLQLRQGTDHSLGDPGDPADGGCAQGDHYSGRSLVIEQKGRQRRARAEPSPPSRVPSSDMFPQPLTRATIVT